MYTLVNSARRLNLIAAPPFHEVIVGDIFHVRAEVDASVPIDRVVIAFEEHFLEVVAGERIVEAPPGTNRLELEWTLYAKAASPEVAIVGIRAQAEGLMQLAEVRVRISP